MIVRIKTFQTSNIISILLSHGSAQFYLNPEDLTLRLTVSKTQCYLGSKLLEMLQETNQML